MEAQANSIYILLLYSLCKWQRGPKAEAARQIGILDSSMVLLEAACPCDAGVLADLLAAMQDPTIAPTYQNGQLYLDVLRLGSAFVAAIRRAALMAQVTTSMTGTGARVDVAVVPKGRPAFRQDGHCCCMWSRTTSQWHCIAMGLFVADVLLSGLTKLCCCHQ